MSKYDKSHDPKKHRHRSFNNTRIISAPPRRRSSVVGPDFPVIETTITQPAEEDRLHRTLYRLPGDARGSTESMEKINFDVPQQQNQNPSTSEVRLDPSEFERFARRRTSNLRMQDIIKKKILIPMADVDRRPEISTSSLRRASFDASTKSMAGIVKELVDEANGTNSKIESIPMQNMGSSRSMETPLSASSRRFANLAKSITLLTSRSRVGDSSPSNPNIQEQNAFFNKYGINSNNNNNSQNHHPNPLNNSSSGEILSTVAPAPLSRIQKIKNWFKFAWKELVIDSSNDSYYYWLGIISFAYLYNLLFVIFRCVFFEYDLDYYWTICFVITDIFCDMLYIGDIYVRSRTGYLDQGLLVRDVAKIVKAYKKTYTAYMDFISVFPADYVLEAIATTPKPILRFNRLLKLDRIQSFISATETRIAVPNAFRIFCVVSYIIVLIHWNACIYFCVSQLVGIGSDGWVYGPKNTQSLPAGVEDTMYRRYVYSFYWSMLILTTIGEVPGPVQNVEFAFVTMDLMCGVLIFATIVGNVGSMISNMSAARTDFQSRVDGIKQYMDLRKVSKHLEVRVIKWFDYLWANKQSLADQQALKVLPDKLQAEIAMHVHFETLRKVRIFQDCEAGLLAELVLKLKLQVFSPGDYVCRKGDIGREMYIVKRGRLEVVADDGITTFATLQEGSVFGELSILNIAGSKQGNRRSANIRSVGYSDLFALSKNDLWEALREYPEARHMLIQKGRDLLRKDNLLDESAPHENKTAEELALELQHQLTIMQTRMAKLLAEQTNHNTKLQHRVKYLESRLGKYENLQLGRDKSGNIVYFEKTVVYHEPPPPQTTTNNLNANISLDIDDDEEEDDEDD